MAGWGLTKIQLAELVLACNHVTIEKDADFSILGSLSFFKLMPLYFVKLSKGVKSRVTSFLLSCNKTPRRHMFSVKLEGNITIASCWE